MMYILAPVHTIRVFFVLGVKIYISSRGTKEETLFCIIMKVGVGIIYLTTS